MKVRFREVLKDEIVNIEEIYKVVVYQGMIGDCEDPDIYVAEPIWKWKQSDAGKFVMANAIEQPSYHTYLDHETYGYKFAIVAELEKKKLSEFYLKFGKP